MVGQSVLYVLLLIVGFVVMVKGADWLVDGAAGLAAKMKISSLVIGLTVVALGTSAPEAAVSTISAITGNAGTAIGNIIGSNIMNIFLILGIASLIAQIPVEKSSRCIEIPFLLAITVLFVVFGLTDGSFSWWEGLILFVLYFVFTAYTVVMAKRQKGVLLEEATATSVATDSVDGATNLTSDNVGGLWTKVKEKYEYLKQKTWFLIILTIVGIGCVVGGGIAVQQAAQFIALELLKIDEIVVGLTVVAFGTSLPELVTSISAARKGDMGIATGNVIGSNIANILFVGGLSFICSGSNNVLIGSPAGFIIDCAVSLIAAVVLLIFSLGKNHKLGKAAGVTMLGILALYYTYLFLSAYNVIVLPML